MFVPGTDYKVFNVSNALVQLAKVQAGPNFELQFAAAQDAVLDRMDAEIEKLEDVKLQDGATALLDLQVNSLQREVDRVREYHDRTKSNGINVGTLTTQLADARALADPGTVAEFDAKVAEAINTLNKIQTRFPEPYGINDRLRAARNDALGTLEALNHNNFATAQDIADVQAALDAVSTSFTTPSSILTQNQTAAFNLLDNNDARIAEINAEIASIKNTGKSEQLEKIEDTRQHFGNILTILSLAFEGSQNIANFVADSTLLRQTEAQPGTVLSLFA